MWVSRVQRHAASTEWAAGSRTKVPANGRARASAVLVLLGAGPVSDEAADEEAVSEEPVSEEPEVVLIERASSLRRHAGEIAFPGGASDPVDRDPAATALREANEEIGLDPSSVQVLIALTPLYIPPSGYVVTPVLAYWHARHAVGAVDAIEVAAVHSIQLRDLAAPTARYTVRSESGYTGPAFDVGGIFVWGFTAWVLDHLLRLGGWELPWDAGRERAIARSERAGGLGDGTPV